MVAHNLAKVRVASSNLVIRSGRRRELYPAGLTRIRWRGREARQRPAKPYTRVRIPSPPRPKQLNSHFGAIGAAVARFPDTEEVTGSIPVSPTRQQKKAGPRAGFFLVDGTICNSALHQLSSGCEVSISARSSCLRKCEWVGATDHPTLQSNHMRRHFASNHRFGAVKEPKRAPWRQRASLSCSV